jgi:hypothetical protein
MMDMDWEKLGFLWEALGLGRAPDRYDKDQWDGREVFGYDEVDGTTTWYLKDGDIDSVMPTDFVEGGAMSSIPLDIIDEDG